MTKAEAYLDRLHHEYDVWQKKVEGLPADCDATTAVYLMYTEVTLTVKGEKLYNDIMSDNYTCKPVEEAVY